MAGEFLTRSERFVTYIFGMEILGATTNTATSSRRRRVLVWMARFGVYSHWPVFSCTKTKANCITKWRTRKENLKNVHIDIWMAPIFTKTDSERCSPEFLVFVRHLKGMSWCNEESCFWHVCFMPHTLDTNFVCFRQTTKGHLKQDHRSRQQRTWGKRDSGSRQLAVSCANNIIKLDLFHAHIRLFRCANDKWSKWQWSSKGRTESKTFKHKGLVKPEEKTEKCACWSVNRMWIVIGIEQTEPWLFRTRNSRIT